MNKKLKNWNKATQELTDEFIRKYFVEDGIKFEDIEQSWVGDEIGGVFCVGDNFYNVDRVRESLELNVIWELLQEYQEFEQLFHEDRPCLNFKTFVRMSYELRFKALCEYLHKKYWDN